MMVTILTIPFYIERAFESYKDADDEESFETSRNKSVEKKLKI